MDSPQDHSDIAKILDAVYIDSADQEHRDELQKAREKNPEMLAFYGPAEGPGRAMVVACAVALASCAQDPHSTERIMSNLPTLLLHIRAGKMPMPDILKATKH